MKKDSLELYRLIHQAREVEKRLHAVLSRINTPAAAKDCRTIINAVAGYYGLNPAVIISAGRRGDWVWPRHVAAYLCRTLTKKSSPIIAQSFGGRHHSSILYASQQVKDAMQVYPEKLKEVQEIEQRLNHHA